MILRKSITFKRREMQMDSLVVCECELYCELD